MSTVIMEDVKLRIVQHPSAVFNAKTLLSDSKKYDDLIYIKKWQVGWSFLGTLCVIVNALLIIKNLYIILSYLSNRKEEGNTFRP